ncbi:hypothetical protein GUJ93_ZPchr0006g46284 [Zizania palustris]|uniref:Uncharacterized protein n=1 Tax=Zizania palustris TaxID=103762 RepID=A0A8J5T2V3_ZIZPA|nr:hypothetical protein GUJ93_ZPchr0006g46284 [Zizania palustris]
MATLTNHSPSLTRRACVVTIRALAAPMPAARLRVMLPYPTDLHVASRRPCRSPAVPLAGCACPAPWLAAACYTMALVTSRCVRDRGFEEELRAMTRKIRYLSQLEFEGTEFLIEVEQQRRILHLESQV